VRRGRDDPREPKCSNIKQVEAKPLRKTSKTQVVLRSIQVNHKFLCNICAFAVWFLVRSTSDIYPHVCLEPYDQQYWPRSSTLRSLCGHLDIRLSIRTLIYSTVRILRVSPQCLSIRLTMSRSSLQNAFPAIRANSNQTTTTRPNQSSDHPSSQDRKNKYNAGIPRPGPFNRGPSIPAVSKRLPTTNVV
jgi:hypothetical protein